MLKASARLLAVVLVLLLSVPHNLAEEIVLAEVSTPELILDMENGLLSKATALTSIGEIEFNVSSIIDATGTVTAINGSWRVLDNPTEEYEVAVSMLTETSIRIALTFSSFGAVVYDFNTTAGDVILISDSLDYESAQESPLYLAGLELVKAASVNALEIGDSGADVKGAIAVVASMSLAVFNQIGTEGTVTTTEGETHRCALTKANHAECMECCSDAKSEGLIACIMLGTVCGIFGAGAIGGGICLGLCTIGVEAMYRRCRRQCNSRFRVTPDPAQ